jgi:molybdopterin/thiamine biosynthesis adenylyltransferase
MTELLDDIHLTRYARHILLDDFGIEGQCALLAAQVLVIGVGGLGCAVLPYLATAGIQQLTLVDGDIIEPGNLQRQILFQDNDLGQAKALVAQARLQQLNPSVSIQAIVQRAEQTLLDSLVAKADVVLDCTDNFATRQAINQSCVRYRVPLISGAVMRFAGQASVFDTRSEQSPCYACAFSAEAHLAEENCALMGVFSPAVAMIGAVQAAQALKLLTGIGQPLIGKLLRLDALTLDWTSMQLTRDHDCLVCKDRGV